MIEINDYNQREHSAEAFASVRRRNGRRDWRGNGQSRGLSECCQLRLGQGFETWPAEEVALEQADAEVPDDIQFCRGLDAFADDGDAIPAASSSRRPQGPCCR